MDNWNDSEKTTSRIMFNSIKGKEDHWGNVWHGWQVTSMASKTKKIQMPKGIGYNHGYTFWESSKCSRQSGLNLVNLICVLVVCTIWFLRWSSHGMLIGPTLRLFNCLCSRASRIPTILWMSVCCSRSRSRRESKNWESMCSWYYAPVTSSKRWLIIGSVRLLSSFSRDGD
jgi:hypothetical protein